MSAKKQEVKEKKTSAGSMVFRVIFIILYVILAALVVITLVPQAYKVTLGSKVLVNILSKLSLYINDHCHHLLNFSQTILSYDTYQTGLLELIGLAGVGVTLIYFFIKSLMLIGYVRKSERGGKGIRIFLLVLMAIINLAFIAYGVITVMNSYIPVAGEFCHNLYIKVGQKFIDALSSNIVFSFGNKVKGYGGFFAWCVIFAVILNLIYLPCVCLIGKKKKEEEAEAPKEETITPVDETQTSDSSILVNAVDNTQVPTPVAAAAETKEDKIVASRRDFAILNTLEPYELNEAKDLPGLYETDVNQIIEDLEPTKLTNVEIIEIPEDNKPVRVLPGVDEWNANPWGEDRYIPEEIKTEVPAEDKYEDMTAQAKATEENTEIFQEVQPSEEPVEEAKEVVAEQAEEVKPEIVEEKVEEVIEEKPVPTDPKDRWTAINFLDGNVTETTTDDNGLENTWTLPEYVEEPIAEEPVKEPIEEKPAEEKKPEPVKPMGTVKPMAPILNPNLKRDESRKPINLVTPIKHDEPVAEEPVEEKKVIAPISGPLHSINTNAAKKDIKPVAARKVKFDLKRYVVKTYAGNLTAAEAFEKGVTKVSPVVNPMVANQKGGYSKKKDDFDNLVVVENLTPVKPASKGTDLSKATSLRDIAKANKAAEQEKPAEAPAESNIARPATPIKLVTPIKHEDAPVADKTEEKKDAPKPVAMAHPVSFKKPSANKPKPINPIKPIKPTK